MKCVCGYEHEEEWDRENRVYKTVVGNRKFIRIEGDLKREVELNYGGTDTESVTLYACPECYTVKMG